MNIGINQYGNEHEKKRSNFVGLDQVINGQKSENYDETGYGSHWNPGTLT